MCNKCNHVAHSHDNPDDISLKNYSGATAFFGVMLVLSLGSMFFIESLENRYAMAGLSVMLALTVVALTVKVKTLKGQVDWNNLD